ncbi:hypothetical protein JCM10207_007839 [Rhodosporidiobolus poonsookiae]
MYNPSNPFPYYQPAPQPLHPSAFSSSAQPFAPSPSPTHAAKQPSSLEQAYRAYGGVGAATGGDFELFGPSPSPPSHQQQAYPPQRASYAGQYPPPPALVPGLQQSSATPLRSPYAPSTSSHGGENDFSSSLPDLVPDSPASRRSSGASFSPPSPRFLAPSRPPLADLSGGKGSYRSNLNGLGGLGTFGMGIERPASVPIPEPPRGMVRRKTQERRDWPSFYSSGSSSSSSSSTNQYLPQAPPAQHQGPYTDEPASYTTPTPGAGAQPSAFDPSSLALSPSYAPFSTPTLANPTGQPGFSALYYDPVALPHTDHPLLASEQSDLLDRVRRDLLDVDLSSIKGPLRALALSNAGGSDRDSTPTPSAASVPPPSSAAAQLTPTQAQGAPLRSPRSALLSDDASAGTVSPQEAFLDYRDVDARLHDPRDPLFQGSGPSAAEHGVGVGHSLFAPLPGFGTPALAALQALGGQGQAQGQPASPAPAHVRREASVERSPTPKASAALALAGDASASASPAPSSRRPHPFSVPQNAVTWAALRSRSGRHYLGGVVDGDADDEDGDLKPDVEGLEGESTSTEAEADEGEESKEQVRRMEAVRTQARLGEGFGRFRKEDADLRRAGAGGMSAAEKERFGVSDDGEEQKPFALGGGGAGVGPHGLDQRQLQKAAQAFLPDLVNLQQPLFGPGSYGGKYPAQQPPQQQQQQPYGFAPPAAPAPSSLLPSLPVDSTPSSTGTATPRRAAAASALAGFTGLPVSAFAPPAPAAPASAAADDSPRRPLRDRKRSRLHRDAYGSDDETADVAVEDVPVPVPQPQPLAPAPPQSVSAASSTTGGDDAGNESDASYRSSASSFSLSGSGSGAYAPPASSRRSAGSSAAPPNKRRRRAPAASGSAPQGSILCDHLNADGSPCGVAFRRPYDLARHKETIHAETLAGEKLAPGRAKEWKCDECGGTFSRKDALLRHSRIRGHRSGV